MNGILSEISEPAWCVSPEISKENSRGSLKMRMIFNKFITIVTYADIWAYMVFIQKIGACIMCKAINIKKKTVESQGENDIQLICYQYNICRYLGLCGILS